MAITGDGPKLARTGARQLLAHRDSVNTVSWACDGRRLASGGGKNDKALRIWTPERTECALRPLLLRPDAARQGLGRAQGPYGAGHVGLLGSEPSGPSASAANQPALIVQLASTSYDKTTRLWDIRRA